MPITLKSYQIEAIDHIVDRKRCAIWLNMGMGKTVSALYALVRLMLIGEIDSPVLVIAPLRVAKTTWPDEIIKYAPYLRCVCLCELPAKERAEALLLPAEIYTINFDQLVWLVNHYGDKWPFKTVVVDESTRLKGFRLNQGTQRAKALAKPAIRYITRFIELTGTPSPNGLKDLWGQLFFLDAGMALGRTYQSFCDRWFQRSFNGFGIEPMEHAQKEIEKAVQHLVYYCDPKDHFDLADPIVTNVFIDLPPAARVAYRELEADMYTSLLSSSVKTFDMFGDEVVSENTEVAVFNAAARTQKCLQLASGAVYIPDPKSPGRNKGWNVMHDAKLDALEDIIEEAAGMPVLVCYQFKSDLARLKTRFKKGRELDKKSSTIKEWNEGKIPVMFLHPASAAHGLNLQYGGNIIVFLSQTWNFEEYSQAIERIGPVRQLQAGFNRNVFIYNILARDTVDELVVENRGKKKKVQDILLEAMKRNGIPSMDSSNLVHNFLEE